MIKIPNYVGLNIYGSRNVSHKWYQKLLSYAQYISPLIVTHICLKNLFGYRIAMKQTNNYCRNK